MSRVRGFAARHPDAAACGALVLATLALHPQLAIGMPWGFGHDALEYAVPHAAFFFRELAAGRLPLWNPFHDGGTPFLSQPPWMGPFYPGVALFLLPWGRALDAGFLLHIVSFTLGCYALARTRDIGRPAAALAALALGGGTPLSDLARFGYLPEALALSYLPWVLACLDRGVRGVLSPLATVAGTGGLLGLMHLGGHLVASGATLFGAAFYALGLGASSARAKRSWKPLLQALALLAGSEAVGIALAAVQLTPFVAAGLESSLRSGREISHEYDYLTELWRLANFLFVRFDPVGKGHLFVGVTLLPFVALAGRSRGRAGRGTAELWVLFAGALLLSLGDATPVWRVLRAALPPLEVFSYFYFLLVPAAVGLALLAAHGLDAWLGAAAPMEIGEEGEAGGREGRPYDTVIGQLGLACAALAAMVLLTLWASLGTGDTRALARPFARASAPWTFLFLAALSALVLVRRRRPGLSARVPWLLAVLLFAELALFTAQHWLPGEPFVAERYFRGRELARAMPEAGTGRVAHVECFRYARDWALQRNEGLIDGYEDIGRHSKLPLERVAMLTDQLQAFDLDWVRSLGKSKRPPPSDTRLHLAPGSRDLAILDLLDVETLVTDLPIEGDSFDVIAGAVIARAGGAPPVRAWHRTPPPRRFFLAEKWREVGTIGEALDQTLSPHVDPFEEPVVEVLRPAAAAPPERAAGSPGCHRGAWTGREAQMRAALVAFSPSGAQVAQNEWIPGCTELEVLAVAPSLLSLGEMASRGWRVWIDGALAPTAIVNAIGLAVFVPAGTHQVVARYVPDELRVGAAVSAATALALLVVAIAPRRRGRRRATRRRPR